jgi:hypothetical protein
MHPEQRNTGEQHTTYAHSKRRRKTINARTRDRGARHHEEARARAHCAEDESTSDAQNGHRQLHLLVSSTDASL